MTEYYVSGCIDNGSEVETCDDSEATFWTLYERGDDGLSQGIIDCTFREDAEAAMRVYQERDRLQQQVNALAAEVHNCRDFVAEHLGPEAELQFSGLSTDFADAIKRQWMAEGNNDAQQTLNALAKLNNELYRWTSRMSYNGSWVGEPEGLIKGHIREMEKILDSSQLGQPEEKGQ